MNVVGESVLLSLAYNRHALISLLYLVESYQHPTCTSGRKKVKKG